MSTEPLLDVEDLTVRFSLDEGVVRAVQDISFSIDAGQRLAIVGESGSGKTVTALAIMGLVELPGRVEAGFVRLEGRDLRGLAEDDYRKIRGSRIAMIFQDPLASLNPVMAVGAQLVETIRVHRRLAKRQAIDLAVELLSEVGIPNARQRVHDYPHQFSGGMRQRVGIALALSCNPDILIADEPTTSLDVTIQAQILDLLHELTRLRGTAVILITHDLAVVASFADRVIVMYGGRIVEQADSGGIFSAPGHPYTRGLLESASRLDRPRAQRLHSIPGHPPSPTDLPPGCAFHPRCGTDVRESRCHIETPSLLGRGGHRGHLVACHFSQKLEAQRVTAMPLKDEPVTLGPPPKHVVPGRIPGEDTGQRSEEILLVLGLTKHFAVTTGTVFQREVARVRAVDDVSFVLHRGETLGLVGESGCGKSTTGRAMLRLVEPTAGQVLFLGKDLTEARGRDLRRLRRDFQVIFQDPSSSLNPRLKVADSISEPLRVHGVDDIGRRVRDLLEQVGLDPEHGERYPHEFSGGQCQRIAIARALATDPKLIFCDEPLSSLDVSIRGQILNLLLDLQGRLGLSYVLVSHDLSVVRDVAHKVAVMYMGKIIEFADTTRLYARPLHPYTIAMLSAVPVPDPSRNRVGQRVKLDGDVPSPIDPPPGCRFHTRCWKAEDLCRKVEPPLLELLSGHWVACHFPVR